MILASYPAAITHGKVFLTNASDRGIHAGEPRNGTF
jgi:hypothetical protein